MGSFPRWSGIVLLSTFVIYMVITLIVGKKNGENELPSEDITPEEDTEEKGGKTSLFKEILLLVGGAAVIAVGADLLVDNGTIIAEFIGVPSSVIALTFVALGTSLPELVTAITSLVKGHSALSLGNVIGANLFNIVLVSGMSITINPFEVPAENTIAGINSSLLVDIPLMFIVMLLLTLPAFIKKKLSRAQGISLFVLYFSFVVFQFVIGLI